MGRPGSGADGACRRGRRARNRQRPPRQPRGPGAEWMAEFRGGDESAFDKIVGFYQEGVFRFLVRAVKDAGRSEDLAQEAFLRVYRSRNTYRPLAGFRSWLFTIAHRLALNELRRSGDAGDFPDLLQRKGRAGRRAGEDFWANVEDKSGETPLDRMELES